MKTLICFTVSLGMLAAANAWAATRYVWQDSPSPGPPYTNWTSAAHVIQEAVDAAQTGDEVVVTNGTYATGGRTVGTNLLVNRVAVDKPLTLRSVNGPTNTIIRGYQVPGTTNGDSAIRCVYLANGASLSGFTLTNGGTRTTGDFAREQTGGGLWCESTNAVVSNCVLAGNSAFYGGGASGGTLNNCTLTGNSAERGGGAFWGTLNNCTLTGNSALDWGGGASGATLNNCTLTGNSAYHGGGGVFVGSLNNCIVYFNTAPTQENYDVGGAYYSVFMNYCCTTPLPEPWQGVGNITLDPQLGSASHLSATSPCRGAGSAAYTTGTDIDGEAWNVPPSIGCDEYRAGAVTGPLTVGIAAEFTNVVVGYPGALSSLIDGRTTLSVWLFGDGTLGINHPYVTHVWTVPGDYTVDLWVFNESHPEGVSASVTIHVVAQPVHYVAADSTNPVPPYTSWATAATNIQDAVDAAGFGPLPPGSALVLVSNGVYATGGRWLYGSNRVAVYKPVAVRSVKGPEYTVIQGHQLPGTTNGNGAVRCVYLTNGASLSGFALTKGATTAIDWGQEQSGGGLWCESDAAVVSNCVLVGNSAYARGGGASEGVLIDCALIGNSADWGGGAYFATLNNCTLSGNLAVWGAGVEGGTLNNCVLARNTATNRHPNLGCEGCGGGGGAEGATLNNCTVVGNSAAQLGGGVLAGTLNNCIVYLNTAPDGANHVTRSPWGDLVLNYCCTTPIPTNGVGNITNAPLFVDYAGGNLRLQSNSPCINAGRNAYSPGPTDLDGLPRIVSGTVDIGAYEFQGPGSVISYAWLQQYGLPTDGSADAKDADGDGHNLWQEWRTGTCPTNALSVLRLLSASPAGTNITVTWQSVEGVSYFLERSTNLATPTAFVPVATTIVGKPGTTSFTDTNAAALAPRFYRVGVSE